MTKQSTNKYLNNTFMDHLTENQHKLEKYALCPCFINYIQEYLPLEKKSINHHQSAILSNLMGTKPFSLTILIVPHWLFILHHHSQAQYSLRTRNPQYQTARPIPSTNASTWTHKILITAIKSFIFYMDPQLPKSASEASE